MPLDVVDAKSEMSDVRIEDWTEGNPREKTIKTIGKIEGKIY